MFSPNVLLFFAIFFGILILLELLQRKFHFPSEVARKIGHILTGSMFALLPLFMGQKMIALVAGIIFLLMIIERKFKIFHSIHDIRRRTYGAIYFPLSIGIIAFFVTYIPAYIFGVFVMALSDGLAALIGHAYDGKKYYVGSARKSYVGSFVFFIVTVLLASLVFTNIGISPLVVLFPIILIALLLMVLEGISPFGIDNLLLPPAAALLFLLIFIMYPTILPG